jgi:radical SAM superfamily enzyme YgiQ (UPF0313 family)
MVRNLEKIVIAVPPVERSRSFVGVSLPPLGPVRMATMLKQRFPETEIEVLDGVMLGQNRLREYAQRLGKNSLLGISAHTSLNWTNCLDLIKNSKSKVVVGGIHADGKRCGRLIVKNHGVDVIQGQGELPFIQYVEYLSGKRKKEEVDNLIYAENGDIRENQRVSHRQPFFPFADYEIFLPLNEYAKNFRDSFLTGDIGLTMISPEGCKWQDMTKENGYCIFCDIGTDFVLHEPVFFGKWIEDHVRRYGKYGKVFLVNYADEATGAGIDWWKAVLGELPKKIRPHEDYAIKVYTKAGRGFLDSSELGDVLWDIGVEDIHVGFEAATDEDLRTLHKGVLMRYNYQLVDIAKNSSFRIFASFVLGAPTSTSHSLEQCVEFTDYMKDKLGDKVAVVTGSPLMPLPGAPAWELLRREATERNQYLDLFETDNPDLYLARRLWYEWFCEPLCSEFDGVDSALEYVKEIGDKLNGMGSLPTPKNEYG